MEAGPWPIEPTLLGTSSTVTLRYLYLQGWQSYCKRSATENTRCVYLASLCVTCSSHWADTFICCNAVRYLQRCFTPWLSQPVQSCPAQHSAASLSWTDNCCTVPEYLVNSSRSQQLKAMQEHRCMCTCNSVTAASTL
jgi:hypothetical protein